MKCEAQIRPGVPCGSEGDCIDRDGRRLCETCLYAAVETHRDQLEFQQRRIAALLENEFGGFFLSAPTGTPLAEVRDILRHGKAVEPPVRERGPAKHDCGQLPDGAAIERTDLHWFLLDGDGGPGIVFCPWCGARL